MSRRRRRHDLPALVSDAREVVELAEAGAERLRSEHDGDRIDVALLVQGAELERPGGAGSVWRDVSAAVSSVSQRRAAALEERRRLRLERPESRAP